MTIITPSIFLARRVARWQRRRHLLSFISRRDRDPGDLAARYPKAQIRDFDGDPDRVTEMDALIAYLQMLGTLVDFESGAPLEELAEETGR